MNFKIVHIVYLLMPFLFVNVNAQDIDTLVDVGGFKMHFYVWKGQGTPILFESGGGNDGSIWNRNELVSNVHEITGATMITYDRSGYGKSDYNLRLADNKRALISHGIENLTTGLKKLNLFEELIIVAHSYGGLYASYLSSKFPNKVKGIVLIDASLNTFYTEEYINEVKAERTEAWMLDMKSKSEPLYYECLANMESIEIMKKIEIPSSIPIIDLVAEIPPFSEENNKRWVEGHKAFVKLSPNREVIVASNCRHYLHFDYSILAVNSIVKMFTKVSKGLDLNKILEKSLTYNVEQPNKYREGEFDYWRSERSINLWGYDLTDINEMENAERVLELNTQLFPESANTWDSYGEILMMNGKKQKGIAMYKKSLELDPNNEGAKKILKEMSLEK